MTNRWLRMKQLLTEQRATSLIRLLAASQRGLLFFSQRYDSCLLADDRCFGCCSRPLNRRARVIQTDRSADDPKPNRGHRRRSRDLSVCPKALFPCDLHGRLLNETSARAGTCSRWAELTANQHITETELLQLLSDY